MCGVYFTSSLFLTIPVASLVRLGRDSFTPAETWAAFQVDPIKKRLVNDVHIGQKDPDPSGWLIR